MGLIKEYSMIIRRSELKQWVSIGWAEDMFYRDFNYAPVKDEAIILGKPVTLADIEIAKLIGTRITNYCNYLGTYGMGGPGFFGLLIDRDGVKEYLTYAVWASGQYIMMDDRVFECHLTYNLQFQPWISQWSDEKDQWDDLSEILKESIIVGVDLTDSQLNIEIVSKEVKHIISFYKFNKELPPHGNGEARKHAFEEGNISNYIVFCNADAVLHV
ncbi:hypothetical protein [Paenibacillus pectinilyticus]|nr:hypothetical protein [Paenibacillus pectinilyticus]